jgi:hypothetical protein
MDTTSAEEKLLTIFVTLHVSKGAGRGMQARNMPSMILGRGGGKNLKKNELYLTLILEVKTNSLAHPEYFTRAISKNTFKQLKSKFVVRHLVLLWKKF